jgi:hypothetical protein
MNIMATVTQNITNIINESWVSLLTEISKDYNIDFEELKNRYLTEVSIVAVKKRGRKKKIKDEYIEAEEFEYNGETYLIDKNGIIYSNDSKNPVMLGQKKRDGHVYFVYDNK